MACPRSRRGGHASTVRRYVLPLVLVALGLLSACSYGVEAAPPQPRPLGPENPSGNPTPETWLAQVCTALTPAVRSTTPVPEIRPEDLLGSRQQMIVYLDMRVTAFDAAADGINRAGPPPVEAGQMVTEPVVQMLRARSEELASLREELRAVPEVDEATLLDTLRKARGRLVLGGSTVSLPDLSLPPSLTAQAATVPSCQALGIGAPR
ncbi:hypothetical protein [Actinomycetospora cinnamomea]|uniref:Uncharacterized protein n=1 Tax=Actinomycetospora cinnamomea TaxID=663609 RepID=A0A2U1F3X4_9PSEU|nr:hypothetical protein [Actinomycetospora cinnamomea]PVZ06883.1 hypothetical protein C8D89_11276 [Actinomycetospora cinnamomea]